MNKKIIIPIFLAIFIFLFSSVSASYICFQDGCSGQILNGSAGQIGFGSNYKNSIISPNISYSVCYADQSVKEIPWADFNNDKIQDAVIVTSSNLLEIVESNCNLVTLLTLSYTPVQMPLIMNFDGDENEEIVLSNGTQLFFYEYSIITNSIENIFNASYSTENQIIACTDRMTGYDFKGCILSNTSSRNVTVLNMSAYPTYTETKYLNSFDYVLQDYTYNRGSATFGQSKVGLLLVPNCRLSSRSPTVNCSVTKVDGTQITEFNRLNAGAASAWTKNHQTDSYYARFGSLDRFVYYDNSNAGSGTCGASLAGTSYAGMFDLTGSSIVAVTGSCLYIPSVADYDKDGTNEFIATYTNGTVFVYNGLGSLKYAHQYNMSLLNTQPVWADFYTTVHNSVTTTGYALCMANLEAIQCINDSGTAQIMTLTGLNATAVVGNYKTWQTTVVNNPFSLSPVVAYSSDTYTAIIYNPLITASCGNGVCEAFENQFSCALDCGLAGSGSCYSDADCAAPYSSCVKNSSSLIGVCAAGATGILCIDDTYCPVNSSLCYQGQCVAGVYNQGTANPSGVLQGNLENSVDIDIFWKMMFRGSLLWRLVIGIITMIVAAGWVNKAINEKGDGLVTIIVFGSMIGMFTLLQLISTWISIFIVIIILALIVARYTIFSKPSEG